ncbi:mitochondrial fission ELM1 family protein [Luteolibacter pohnpeiensis]|uniref:Mitochondrial fission ELM1 family protein n=1 Tax=Luteolibacter pohnpeiensis TaxID=454153 RepID=A0A934VW68_9BACT|nr:ELM1/GtrOC1 family putative glycosyltransferase [Luteolibacter pohnpeiensis]MBK1882503.1 mitochondrial fission ELM1 family protein [Luteolibacter pohnpeiensis]
MKRVWILDEGSQGHVVQSRGLVRELAKFVPIEVTEVPIQCSVPRRFRRSLVKRLLRMQRKMWMFRLLHPRMELPDETPELIISSGPHSFAALAFLSKFYQCPSVFVQGTIRVPQGSVTCTLRPDSDGSRADIIRIPLLFNEITPEVIANGKIAYETRTGREKSAPLKALFIGESSGKIEFSASDWDHLIDYINQSWRRDGIQWLVSTSYRTRLELEDKLRENIEPAALFDAVWYSREPRKITREFLGMADQVLVTMDSLTMMTEAIASGRPVQVVSPADHQFDPADSHHRYIQGLIDSGLVHLLIPGKPESESVAVSEIRDIDYAPCIRAMLKQISWSHE